MTNSRYRQTASTAARPVRPILSDINEEMGTLGAALLDPEQAAEILLALEPSDFSYSSNQIIFRAMAAAGAPFDVPSIAGELNRQGLLDQVGEDYLVRLDLGVVTARPMARRIARLKEWRRLRELVNISEELAQLPYDVGANSTEIIAKLRERLEDIAR
jgi:replicative DNA helicase